VKGNNFNKIRKKKIFSWGKKKKKNI